MDIQQCYQRARQGCPDEAAITVLHIGDDESWLAVGIGSKIDKIARLAFGSHKTAAEHFRHSPPTPGEMELAIVQVEDELFRIRGVVSGYPALVTLDECLSDLRSLLAANPGQSNTFTVEAVELAFSALASRSHGSPPSTVGMPDEPTSAATLLILREFMHHLKFASIMIAK